ncbi:hypothetical protein L3X38_015013 [Prunus dulcis]|uniref:Uncharacterized protein n=1 Tax=Prunus dulcis TaxID=3755 RepID=A0AAD4WQY2_PRUDU|nr:hypothetical protein L3X38_015013 [Prunus dulcis]
MCRTHPESLKRDPGARQLPKEESCYRICSACPESFMGDPVLTKSRNGGRCNQNIGWLLKQLAKSNTSSTQEPKSTKEAPDTAGQPNG